MKRAAVALVTLILLVSSLAAQPPSGVPSSLQLVEATVPELQLALQSRLITSEQHTLSDIIAFNNADAAVALKYGQAIFLAANQLDTSPGSADTQRYMADRAQDLALTRTGLDAVFNGPDGVQGTEDDFDAILFPQNRGAAAPAKAGYPSIVVPGGFVPPTGAVINPAPFGVTFSGRAFSEPRLLALA